MYHGKIVKRYQQKKIIGFFKNMTKRMNPHEVNCSMCTKRFTYELSVFSQLLIILSVHVCLNQNSYLFIFNYVACICCTQCCFMNGIVLK